MKTFIKVALSVSCLAGIGILAFLVVRVTREDSSVVGQDDPLLKLAQYQADIADDAAAPRFTGELLGVFLAPSEKDFAAAPPNYVTPERFCGRPGPQVAVPWERAGQLDFSVELPPSFTYLPDDLDTGVIACNNEVYAARRAYEHGTGRVIIARGAFNVAVVDAPVDRIKTVALASRPAVLVQPLYPAGSDPLGSGGGTIAQVIFPERFGTTTVSSYSMPLSEVMQVAELVAQATK